MGIIATLVKLLNSEQIDSERATPETVVAYAALQADEAEKELQGQGRQQTGGKNNGDDSGKKHG